MARARGQEDWLRSDRNRRGRSVRKRRRCENRDDFERGRGCEGGRTCRRNDVVDASEGRRQRGGRIPSDDGRGTRRRRGTLRSGRWRRRVDRSSNLLGGRIGLRGTRRDGFARRCGCRGRGRVRCRLHWGNTRCWWCDTSRGIYREAWRLCGRHFGIISSPGGSGRRSIRWIPARDSGSGLCRRRICRWVRSFSS